MNVLIKKKETIMHATTTKDNTVKSLKALPMILLMLLLFTFCTAQDNKVPTSAGHKTEYVMDTMTLFDPDTYEERTVIYKVPATLKSTADGMFPSEWLQNGAQGYTLDTVTIYDPVSLKPKWMKITVVLHEK